MTSPTAMAHADGRTEPSFLQQLNPMQRRAAETTEGPVLVLAGAGTGKTRVLTSRIALLLHRGQAQAGQILAVTFTNKAAQEMAERVGSLVGQPTVGWWLGTFHSLSARLLRRHAERVGLTPAFTILDSDDQLRLIQQLLEAERLDDRRSPARLVLNVIDRWKDRALLPEQLPASEVAAVDGLAMGRLPALYAAYQQRLRTLDACDFGDLILHVVELLRRHEDLRATYAHRFRYVLVDEYQDTNVAQYLWLRLLVQGHGNLCVVGDDDQSIYGWRGAEVGNILRFEQDFPGAAIIRLEQNYRSTGHILAAASGVIAHNRDRLGKTLWTEAEAGQPVAVRIYFDGEAEARAIADQIESLQRQRVPLAQIAVMVRTSAQIRECEERFMQQAIAYRVVGDVRFYERQEIRDAMAYCRAVVSASDSLAFERIINTPRRGIGPGTLQQLHERARAQDWPLAEAAAALVAGDGLKPKTRATLRQLLAQLADWRAALTQMPAPQLVERILEESGYTAMWQAEKTPEARSRLANLQEYVNAIAEFGSLAGFLEHAALMTDANRTAATDAVSIMTLHRAKGLEFGHVFLPGWEEDLFPSRLALEENGQKALEEERRLAYVGLTRARRAACISYVQQRRLHGHWAPAVPSRFIAELPPEHCDLARPRPAAAGFAEAAQAWPGRATIAGQARRLPERAAHDFGIGDRVFHQKFGYGTITDIDMDKLRIDFDASDSKQVMASFVLAAGKAG